MTGARVRLSEPIRLAVWRPVAVLAALGATPPVVIVSGAADGCGIPAAASAPDVTADGEAAPRTASEQARGGDAW